MGRLRRTLAGFTLLSLIVALSPAGAGSGALLEGRVVGEDGRAASGFAVHLIGDGGRQVGVSNTDTDGIYSFPSLDAGEYHLGIEHPSGGMAPVAGPPVRLGDGELARRDLKLMHASPQQRRQALQGNASLGSWWAGLTPAAKAWSIVAIVVVVGITVAALDDDDEQPASEN